MLTELAAHNKVVGVKQLKKALRDGAAQKVFVAEDADPKLTDLRKLPRGSCAGGNGSDHGGAWKGLRH